jgi:orotate phosphoribosyltransferase
MTMPTKLPEGPAETIEFLKAFGALEEGHFLLASGRHSGHYVKKGLLIQHPWELQRIIEQRAGALGALGRIDAVLSPAVGGIPVGQQLGLALHCRALYAERNADNQLQLKRGFEILPGQRILLVEDVITTGGTLVELERFVSDHHAEVAGIFVVVNRSGQTELLGRPVVSCMEVIFPTYAPDEVPPALAALPLIRPGTKRAG